ncbi:uncharacterized protein F4807DRAFT_449772 [Annulohypoxylon truncatum]|uniref:uncharacterized protein n=1 Tax=Annulohypoxylon truncatum TaxID=327061 RepID=UPI002008C87C|nr:uncharacterized protein F4807DRAFT_449772 [Annulohypoxylon truncatum]KAI1213750.1 hypothetical protein F4807DRAFT_449772 [Annulohypoxylon truncatum]
MAITVRKVVGVALSTFALCLATSVERCERACLENFISDYLNALVAHDPSKLPTTPDVKYVENDQILPLGSGEWHIVESLGKYNHTFSDPEAGQVATITTIVENGIGAIYVVRLKVESDGKISEIETQITRDSGGFDLYEQRGQPEPVWFEAVAPENRISRDELISQADKYYTGMQGNDPKGDYTFFDKECNRLEDGLQTTNIKTGDPYGHSNDTVFASLTCEEQFQTGFLGGFAITTLDHNGTVRMLPSVNGTSSPIPPYFDTPRTLIVMEAFRLKGEKIYRIEMTLTEVPYGMKAGYPQDPPVDLSGPGTNFTVYPDPCDRVCLENVVGDILMSLRVHDHTRLPLAKGIRYSENGQFLALGDGLWETLEAISWTDSYAVVLADEERETAGYWGFSQEHSVPGVLALRIAVSGGQITEIEALAVRAETNDSRGGTMTLMRPPLPVEWEGDESAVFDAAFQERSIDGLEISPELLNTYFDGLEKHSSEGVPFAPGCTRRDNLIQANLTCADQLDGKGQALNGLPIDTTAVRDRRVLAADKKRAIALAVALIDEPGNSPSPSPLPETTRIPGTYMVPQLFKINNGTIIRVESVVKWMPFGYTSEWSRLEE